MSFFLLRLPLFPASYMVHKLLKQNLVFVCTRVLCVCNHLTYVRVCVPFIRAIILTMRKLCRVEYFRNRRRVRPCCIGIYSILRYDEWERPPPPDATTIISSSNSSKPGSVSNSRNILYNWISSKKAASHQLRYAREYTRTHTHIQKREKIC